MNIIFKCYFIYNTVCFAMLSYIFHKIDVDQQFGATVIYTRSLAKDFFDLFFKI